MKEIEFKLKLVESTMKNAKEFAKECMEKSHYWEKAGNIELKEYFEGQARAYRQMADFLRIDLED